MQDLTLILIALAFIFLMLMLLADRRRIVFGLLSMSLWWPVAAVVATEAASVKGFWILFFSLGWFCFAWVAMLVVEVLTGRVIIGEA